MVEMLLLFIFFWEKMLLLVKLKHAWIPIYIINFIMEELGARGLSNYQSIKQVYINNLPPCKEFLDIRFSTWFS